jgi:membrane associated rhomboid family serine protease
MIPLRDENPTRTTPHVTRLLIALNCGVFLYELLLGPDLKQFMMTWGLVPHRLTAAFVTGDEPVTAGLVTLFTSLFLHGGWAHVLGNMWYLTIFGDNVEDLLGHGRYLVFYLVGGLFASLVHYFSNPGSVLPTVGASGAIAAVLGAYVVAFPGTRVTTLIPFFPFFQIASVRASIVLGFWFVIQFFSGAMSLAWSAQGGTAWFAHIGGFAFGWIAMKILQRQPARARWNA